MSSEFGPCICPRRLSTRVSFIKEGLKCSDFYASNLASKRDEVTRTTLLCEPFSQQSRPPAFIRAVSVHSLGS